MASVPQPKLSVAASWALSFAAGAIAGGLQWSAQRDAGLALAAAGLTWAALGLSAALALLWRRQRGQRDALRNLSAALEQTRSAVMIIDRGGAVEYANRELCQLFGYDRHELLGMSWQEISGAQPAGGGAGEIMSTIRGGETWAGEWTHRRADGGECTLRGRVSPVRRRTGQTSCWVAVFENVTEARRREADLREARDRAEAGDRAKGQFLATMSHEVRTPLNGIAGFTSLLLETDLTAEQRDCVQTIKASTEALIQLTGDILDFARIDSGKLTLDPMACDPRECVEDALDVLAVKAAEKRVELLHRIAADVPAAVVVDGGRLRQVLVNLIGNAVKFTDQGEVEVSVRRRPGDHQPALAGQETQTELLPPDVMVAADGCVLEFTVRDTGIGIAAEHHDKLFRPFSQVDESTTRRHGGTGLGLAISHSLVGMMGGSIGLTSERGRGASFVFTVRAAPAAAAPVRPDLRGMRVALAIRTRALRSELADLVRTWQGTAIEADAPALVAMSARDCTVVELSPESARELLAAPDSLAGLPPETTLGLVPISLSNDLRTQLRGHFRLLVNKPVHHAGFFALLSGTQAQVAPPVATRFGLRVLVVEPAPAGQQRVHAALDRLGCTCLAAGSRRDALDQLTRSAGDFDLVLVSLQEGAEGAQTVRDIRAGHAGALAQAMWLVALAAEPAAPPGSVAADTGLNDSLATPLNEAELEAALRRFRTERLARKR